MNLSGNKIYSSIYKSPIGNIKIQSEKDIIIKIELMKSSSLVEQMPNNVTLECQKELEEYFQNKRREFNIKYKLQGTEFEKNVWKQLYKVPYGETVSYKYIAEKVGNPKAVRAVANAIGKNNLLILIPCHRVIGTNGKLTGFSAYTEYKTGLEIKQELLSLEGNKQWK